MTGCYDIVITHTPLTLHVTSGNGRRFARLFSETWRTIPDSDRSAIARRFERHLPTIQLGPPWENWCEGMPAAIYLKDDTMQQVASIHFLGPAIDYLDDHEVRQCVAHELAHVRQLDDAYYSATWLRYHRHADVVDRQILETNANARADEWIGEHDIPALHAALVAFFLATRHGETLPSRALIP
jgi:hypothetical protein